MTRINKHDLLSKIKSTPCKIDYSKLIPDFNPFELEMYDFGSAKGKKNQIGLLRGLTDHEEIARAIKTLSFTMRNDISTRYNEPAGLIDYLVSINDGISTHTINKLKWQVKAADYKNKKLALNHVMVAYPILARHNNESFESSSSALDYVLSRDGVTFVKAPHGDGKSSLLAKPFVKQMERQGLLVVTVAHLTTLIADLATKFDCDHYKRLHEEYKTCPTRRHLKYEQWIAENKIKTIAVCLPSIIKHLKNTIAKADCLIIDEVSQVVRFITSSVGEMNNVDVFEHFCEMIRSAKRILALDADLDSLTAEFFERVRPGEKFNFVTVPNPDKSESGLNASLIYGEKYNDWIVNLAADDLKKGKRIIIATDIKSEAINAAELLKRIVPRAKILTIHSGNSSDKEQRDFMHDADNKAAEYDCIIHSPSIRSGVSISKVHFDTGYAIFRGSTVLPSEAIQMLRRCRTIRSWHIGLSEKMDSSLLDPELLHKQAALHDKLTGMILEDNPEFNKLFVETKAAESECKNNFATFLVKQLDYYGFNVDKQEAKEPELEQTLSDISKELSESNREAIKGAKRITELDFETLQDIEEKTEEQSAQMRAFLIRQSFGVDLITDDHISLLTGGGIRKANQLRWILYGDMMLEKHAKTSSLRRYYRIKAQHIKKVIDLAGDDLETFNVNHDRVETIANYLWSNREALIFLGLMDKNRYSYPQIDRSGYITGYKLKARPKKDGTLVREFCDRAGLLVKPSKGSTMACGEKINVVNYKQSPMMPLIIYCAEQAEQKIKDEWLLLCCLAIKFHVER